MCSIAFVDLCVRKYGGHREDDRVTRGMQGRGHGRERSKEGGSRNKRRLKAESVRKQRPVALQHSARAEAN